MHYSYFLQVAVYLNFLFQEVCEHDDVGWQEISGAEYLKRSKCSGVLLM